MYVLVLRIIFSHGRSHIIDFFVNCFTLQVYFYRLCLVTIES